MKVNKFIESTNFPIDCKIKSNEKNEGVEFGS